MCVDMYIYIRRKVVPLRIHDISVRRAKFELRLARECQIVQPAARSESRTLSCLSFARAAARPGICLIGDGDRDPILLSLSSS